MDHLTPGYYWVIRKNLLQENWSEPKPEYLDESLIEAVREGNYDTDCVCVLGKVLTFFEAEAKYIRDIYIKPLKEFKERWEEAE